MLTDGNLSKRIWSLTGATLCPYQVEEGVWYWVVRYTAIIEPNTHPNLPQQLPIVVPMSGTAIYPTVIDEPVSSFYGIPIPPDFFDDSR